MPPSPRNSPALERALSRDTKRPGDHGWEKGNRVPMEFLFGDGEWHHVEVLASWVDDRGRRVTQIEWRAELTTWGEAFLFEEGKARRV